MKGYPAIFLDDVLIAFFRAPRSYTSEDTVEINAHGGPLVLQRILSATLALGARAARPGEMTLRAFLHGRIDLAQAEAVLALINAETDASRRLAYRQLRGEVSARVQFALSRMVALTGDYSYYKYSFDRSEGLPPGFLQQLARQSIRVGLTLWLPLFH